MADQVQRRGGTTAEHTTFVGAPRELTVDTDKKTVVVHDGFTAGGHPLMRQDMANLTDAGVITASLARVRSIHDLPTSNIGPIIVAEAEEIWTWAQTPYFTGYRSILCGSPIYGHTITPLAREIDAVGGLLSKTAYAGLWGYCRENGLVVSQSSWTANIGAHLFVDVSPTQFRVPDLRNQFLRFTGTDADTANARGLGSRQLATSIRGAMESMPWVTIIPIVGHDGYTDVGGNALYVPSHSPNETIRRNYRVRPQNTAFHPRIHV